MPIALGIDFGTSNSTVGYSAVGQPELIPLEDGKLTIPSAIFYDNEKDAYLYGRAAIGAYTDRHNGRLLRALKSILGSALFEESTRLGRHRVVFKSILTAFLGHLKSTAEARLGHEITSAVLGRPVRFADGNDEADASAQAQLEDCARACGFKYIEFQFEPIAAAFEYERTIQSEEIALIADIGGGTSDCSIVKVSPDKRGKADRREDILANSGVHIGGTDFDKMLSMKEVMPHLGLDTLQRDKPIPLPRHYFDDLATWHRIAFLYEPKVLRGLKELQRLAQHPELVERLIAVINERNGHRLAGDVEAAKIALPDRPAFDLELDYIETGLVCPLEAGRFEKQTSTLRRKITARIEDCLSQAGIKPARINTLFLTGGTASIPSVRAACQIALPGAKVSRGDLFGSVGRGLAIDAENRLLPKAGKSSKVRKA